MQGWLWSLGTFKDTRNDWANVENQFAVKHFSDILNLTLVLYQGVKYYPDILLQE